MTKDFESVPLDGIVANRVAVVTGAGRGVGRSEAMLLASEGARVVVNDFDAEFAERVAAEIRAHGGETVAHAGDIGEAAVADALIERAVREWGCLDIVVNNAGNLRDGLIHDLSEDDWDDVVRAHLRGHFLVTRRAFRHWRELTDSGQMSSGRVINTTSITGLVGTPGQAPYGSAKAGIVAFTQIAAMEAHALSVTVNAIAPAARTRMTREIYTAEDVADDSSDSLDPDNVAPLVVYLASDEAAHVTGQVFAVQGGRVELYQGWHAVSALETPGRWRPRELAEQFDSLFDGRPSRYIAAPHPHVDPTRR